MMKSKIMKSILCVGTSLFLASSVFAAQEYGVIYDETDYLYTTELETLATQSIPSFTSTYDIDVRVNVITEMGDFSTMPDIAEAYYTDYQYGGMYGANAVTLTVLAHMDDTGVSLDDWYVYAAGNSDELINSGQTVVSMALESYFTTDVWSGDSTQDAQAFTEVVNTMLVTLEDFVLSGGVSQTIWNSEIGLVQAQGNNMQTGTNNQYQGSTQMEDWMYQDAQLEYVTDTSQLLTNEEYQTLMQNADVIAQQYGVGVYIFLTDDYTEYVTGDIFEGAMGIYKGYSLGLGTTKDGILLLLSTKSREYALVTHGDMGNYAFNDEGREMMTYYFLDDFADNRWYDGLADYIVWSGEYLNAANNGTPYSADNHPDGYDEDAHKQQTNAADKKSEKKSFAPKAIFASIVSLIVTAIRMGGLGSKMKMVESAKNASNYIVGEVNLTNGYENYRHTTTSKQKRGSNSSTKSSRSGSVSGTSGKF